MQRTRGVLAVETAFAILRPLLSAPHGLTLSALAREAGVPAAKAHRYLVSLIQVGMAVQDSATGRYDLGPAAVRFGVASLERFDTVRHVTSDLARLRDEIGETVSIVVWSDAGPAVARTENSLQAVAVTMRAGTVLPLVESACGRVFLTFLPAETTAPLLLCAPERTRRSISAGVRRHGGARTKGGVLAGVSGFAVPVFDERGALAAVATAYGRSVAFDIGWDGAPARALRAFVRQPAALPPRAPRV